MALLLPFVVVICEACLNQLLASAALPYFTRHLALVLILPLPLDDLLQFKYVSFLE
jgi:hypothetical protein